MLQNGIINVYKPKGYSSFQIVNKVRKQTGIKKIGHAGTLDPLATGVLILLINEGTKLFEYFKTKEKEYKAEIILGTVTDTYDLEGTIISEKNIKDISKEKLSNILEIIKKKEQQIPPLVSAKHYKGKRLYQLFREGKSISYNKFQPIKIFLLELLYLKKNIMKIRVICSSGTYIRSLVKDIGDMIGSGACLKELTRIRVGEFKLEHSIRQSDNWRDNIIFLEEVFPKNTRLIVTTEMAKQIKLGKGLDLNDIISFPEKESYIYPVFDEENRPVALCKQKNNQYVILRVFNI